MRPVQLTRIAAEAEGLRLRRMATRLVNRVVLAVLALFFLIGAVVFVHIAAWYEVQTGLRQSSLATAGILGGADLLLAIIFGGLASSSRPSKVEIEALEVRRKAIQGLRSMMSMTQMVIPIIRTVATLRRRWRV